MNLDHLLNKNDKKTESLQALRALAFFGVFFSHALRPTMWSTLGVSVFYVLSGFLMFIRYSDTEMNASFGNNLKFSVSRIKKMYPLHIITMILALLMNIVLDIHNHVMTAEYALDLVIRTLIDIPLLSAWAPDFSSLNGVAWYLSVMLFLYFVFPFIKDKVKNAKGLTLSVITVLIFVVQVISYKLWIELIGQDTVNFSGRCIWFSYTFPVFRLGDFAVGCFLGKTVKAWACSKSDDKEDGGIAVRSLYSFAEIILLAVSFLIVYYPFRTMLPLCIHPGFNMTSLYIPVAAGWVYLFAMKKGLITDLLTNKVLVYIGDNSAYLFLIHAVVTFYTDRLLNLLDIDATGVILAFVIVIEFFVSLSGCLVYKKIRSLK